MTVTGYAKDTALVDSDWALPHLDDPNVRFVEVDVDTTAYEQSHIPGAVGWNWTSQLPTAIRRDIAVARRLLRAAVRFGHRRRTPRSCCTATTTTGSRRGPTGSSSCTATDDVRILNGGRKFWLDKGLALAVDVPSYARHRLPAARGRLQPARLPRRHPAAPRRPGLALVDVRSPAEFNGEIIAPPGMSETAQRAGHIPGAASIPWAQTVREDGTFKSAEELATCTRPRASRPTRTSSPTAGSASDRATAGSSCTSCSATTGSATTTGAGPSTAA